MGRDARARGEWQGMNWIRQDKRLAIYLRDGLACAWCGDSVEDGAMLTLDHLLPHSKGGTNDERNLVTACDRCNKSRNNRSLRAFARSVAGYINHGCSAKDIVNHVEACRRRVLTPYRVQAKALVAQRGSAAKALADPKLVA